MKLRNKKTGEVVRATNVSAGDNPKWYTSLEELLQDYEDAPKEPLIKDLKIRKAVRAWIEANCIKEIIIFDYINAGLAVPHDEVYFAENGGRLEIHFRTEERFDTDRIYSIIELCGEEEE